MGELFTPIHLIILLFIPCFLAVLIIPYWMIFKKAGFPGALALLIWVPLINLIALYVVAFSRWKVVPAPEFAAGYPPQYPPQAGYPPAYPAQPIAAVPQAYAASAAYTPAPRSYPPPAEPPV